MLSFIECFLRSHLVMVFVMEYIITFWRLKSSILVKLYLGRLNFFVLGVSRILVSYWLLVGGSKDLLDRRCRMDGCEYRSKAGRLWSLNRKYRHFVRYILGHSFCFLLNFGLVFLLLDYINLVSPLMNRAFLYLLYPILQ